MVVRRAVLRAFLTAAVLTALVAVVLLSTGAFDSRGSGFELLGASTVDVTRDALICPMEGCPDPSAARSFCLMDRPNADLLTTVNRHASRVNQLERQLRALGSFPRIDRCERRNLSIRLMPDSQVWPMRPGQPI